MSKELLQQALKNSFQLGQTYFMQVDSQSISQQNQSDKTRKMFDVVMEDTLNAMEDPASDALAAMTAGHDSWQRQCSDRVYDAVRLSGEIQTLKEQLEVFRKAAQEGVDLWNSTFQSQAQVMAKIQSAIDQSTTSTK